MRIVTTRRISQLFFLVLFLWFCFTATLGAAWWQLRGWPVNWFLQLDPLVCLGTLLTTRTIYQGLLWGLSTILLTVLLGRFFCGWICPLGTIQQLTGYIGNRKRSLKTKADKNRYHHWQSIKYGLLIFLLASGVADLLLNLMQWSQREALYFWCGVVLVLAGLIALAWRRALKNPKRLLLSFLIFVGILSLSGLMFDENRLLAGSLQTGLLDPLPLLYRTVNLTMLPFIDGSVVRISVHPRYYVGAWIIGTIFFLIVLLSLKTPRFYCRFICPTGALFGVLSRFAIWRVGKSSADCPLKCHLCETHCEGACEPSQKIRSNECILCMNCLDDCYNGIMTYQTQASVSGEIQTPDVSRRAFVVSLFSGAAVIPVFRLGGKADAGWNPRLIRPPGALEERDFLKRCVKCGQCMRICPTNVIHPDFYKSGIEGLWTPVLDFRIGSSGCQVHCIACGNICPTAAIRPIRLDERMGKKTFSENGPIRIGTAFVDRGRCLPWAMDKPCIVCQENCPVSPKAIFTRPVYQPLRGLERLRVIQADPGRIKFEGAQLETGNYATGDYFCTLDIPPKETPRLITSNTSSELTVAPDLPRTMAPKTGSFLSILVRLQQPYVDIQKCVGCGVCEHECPVKGKRAIRVTAENETRSRQHNLLLKPARK